MVRPQVHPSLFNTNYMLLWYQDVD